MQEILARIAEQQVFAQVAIEKIAARAAMQFVADFDNLGGKLLRRRVDRHRGVGEQKVDPLSAPEPLASLRPVRRARVTKEIISTGIAVHLIDAAITVHDVVIDAAAHNIVAHATEDLILSGAAVGVVVAGTAVKKIGITAAEEKIVIVAAAQTIGTVTEVAGQRQTVECLRCDERRLNGLLGGFGQELRRQFELVAEHLTGRQTELLMRQQLSATPEDVAAGIA